MDDVQDDHGRCNAAAAYGDRVREVASWDSSTSYEAEACVLVQRLW